MSYRMWKNFVKLISSGHNIVNFTLEYTKAIGTCSISSQSNFHLGMGGSMASTSHEVLLAIGGHCREEELFFLFSVAIALGFQCV